MTEKFFTYQSSKIFYRISGSGKPVVLLHGFGEDGEIWQNQIPVLEKQYTLIIPDLPGSGKSELISDMRIEGMADCIKELTNIEALKASTTGGGLEGAFFGHSMGGYITLALAEKYPSVLNALGLIHSSAYADTDEKKAGRKKSIEFIKTNGAYEFLKTAIPGLFYQPEKNSVCEDLVKSGKYFTAEALIAYYTAMINRPDRTTILKTFYKPVLFIMGQHDKAVPFEQSLAQSHLPQQSHIHILRNSAHMGMSEEVDIFNKSVLHFLNMAM